MCIYLRTAILMFIFEEIVDKGFFYVIAKGFCVKVIWLMASDVLLLFRPMRDCNIDVLVYALFTLWLHYPVQIHNLLIIFSFFFSRKSAKNVLAIFAIRFDVKKKTICGEK